MKAYKDLLNALKTLFKNDFNTVEMQQQQIENTKQGNPIAFPALYIEIKDLDWQPRPKPSKPPRLPSPYRSPATTVLAATINSSIWHR